MIIKGVISIFSYGLKTAIDNFNKNEIEIISLCNYDTLLSQALEQNFITPNDLETLESWKKNPEQW
jgi:orotate phosphoribosyltransferase